MMKYLVLLLVPVIAFSLGCAKPYMIGTPVDRAKLDQLVPGTTPDSKVVELLGQPEKKEQMSMGQTKYVYSYYEEIPKFWTKTVQRKTILEVLTQGGVVQKYDLKREAIDSAATKD
jgi:outer membrane protein assembly factor BamE (lipoprotein component of BamABCDE complex)